MIFSIQLSESTQQTWVSRLLIAFLVNQTGMNPVISNDKKEVKTMKKLSFVVLMLAIAGLTVTANAAITTTKHNLSASSTNYTRSQATTAGGTSQICVFCHTPHHALDQRFIWNHAASSNTTWTWGTGSATGTSAGTVLPTNPANLPSFKCISCHDGSVAIGQVNEVFNESTGVVNSSYSIPMQGDVNAAYQLTNSTYEVGVGGNMNGNHPIGIPYPGQSPYNGISSGAGIIISQFQASPTNVELFQDPNGGTGKGVECGSCHAVHGSINPMLLRDAITSSQLCLDCHIK